MNIYIDDSNYKFWPIKSAPKDGTYVDLWVENEHGFCQLIPRCRWRNNEGWCKNTSLNDNSTPTHFRISPKQESLPLQGIFEMDNSD